MRSDLLESVRREASHAGFNLTGVAAVANFDAAAPPAHRVRTVPQDAGWRSVIVVGSGGRSFWEIFKGRVAGARPDELAAADGSIDAYSRAVLPRLATELRDAGARVRTVFPFMAPGPGLSYRRLAEQAGFGSADTVLSILLRPVFGPWVSVRGALVTDADLPATGPLHDFDPCSDCHRRCAAACPIDTFAGASWDWSACLQFRVLEVGCPSACLARRACVWGAAHQYSDEEYSDRHALEPRSKTHPRHASKRRRV